MSKTHPTHFNDAGQQTAYRHEPVLALFEQDWPAQVALRRLDAARDHVFFASGENTKGAGFSGYADTAHPLPDGSRLLFQTKDARWHINAESTQLIVQEGNAFAGFSQRTAPVSPAQLSELLQTLADPDLPGNSLRHEEQAMAARIGVAPWGPLAKADSYKVEHETVGRIAAEQGVSLAPPMSTAYGWAQLAGTVMAPRKEGQSHGRLQLCVASTFADTNPAVPNGWLAVDEVQGAAADRLARAGQDSQELATYRRLNHGFQVVSLREDQGNWHGLLISQVNTDAIVRGASFGDKATLNARLQQEADLVISPDMEREVAPAPAKGRSR